MGVRPVTPIRCHFLSRKGNITSTPTVCANNAGVFFFILTCRIFNISLHVVDIDLHKIFNIEAQEDIHYTYYNNYTDTQRCIVFQVKWSSVASGIYNSWLSPKGVYLSYKPLLWRRRHVVYTDLYPFTCFVHLSTFQIVATLLQFSLGSEHSSYLRWRLCLSSDLHII